MEHKRPIGTALPSITRVALLIPSLIITSCSALQVESPAPDRRIILGSSQSACQTADTQSQWSLLYGAIPLNRPHLDESFKDPTKSYRIKEVSMWPDLLVDLTGGIMLSLTRRTFVIETCDESFVLTTAEQHNMERQREIQTVLDRYLKETTPHLPEEPVFVMASGESPSGAIQEINEKEIVIIVRKSADPLDETKDTILLQDGNSLKGEIVGQTADTVSIRNESGKQTINKKQIRKIEYRKQDGSQSDTTVDGSSKPTFTLETMRLDRSQIRQILLRDTRGNIVTQEL